MNSKSGTNKAGVSVLPKRNPKTGRFEKAFKSAGTAKPAADKVKKA